MCRIACVLSVRGPAKAAASVDLTGYWVSVVTEDCRFSHGDSSDGRLHLRASQPGGRKLADA